MSGHLVSLGVPIVMEVVDNQAFFPGVFISSDFP